MGPDTSISSQENAPQTCPKVSLVEVILQLRFPLLWWPQFVLSWQKLTRALSERLAPSQKWSLYWARKPPNVYPQASFLWNVFHPRNTPDLWSFSELSLKVSKLRTHYSKIRLIVYLYHKLKSLEDCLGRGHLACEFWLQQAIRIHWGVLYTPENSPDHQTLGPWSAVNPHN